MSIQDYILNMLKETCPYEDKPIESFCYHNGGAEYDLKKMVLKKLRESSGNASENERCFKSINSALSEYADHYPAMYSFKKNMRRKFCTWLDQIKSRYGLETMETAPELIVESKEDDTIVAMIQALQDRDGITRENLSKRLEISGRAVSKNLRKLNGDDSTLFRLGGQPVRVNVQAEYKENEKEAYWITKNTMHPIILQENLIQAGVLIQALAHNFYEHGGEVNLIIGIDIWNQLTDYAHDRIKTVFAENDTDMEDFIGILEEDVPGEGTRGFRTEREMMLLFQGTMDQETERIYVEKVQGRALPYDN